MLPGDGSRGFCTSLVFFFPPIILFNVALAGKWSTLTQSALIEMSGESVGRTMGSPALSALPILSGPFLCVGYGPLPMDLVPIGEEIRASGG